ncbi:MAG: CHASE2 domain-containing protein [Xenococcaceae cyanobacterium MO_234.B1]|nr:CHASE2 domain-containing protein [Xenococcaceae cyanobacterium MO_234.B1]
MLILASEWAKVVRVVILKIDGEFELGFNVSLQMGFEGQSFDVEVSGKLPQAPQLLKYLEAWQTQYRQLDFSKRIKPKGIFYNGSINSWHQLKLWGDKLQEEFQKWLQAPSFYNIELKLRDTLDLKESTRMVLCSDNLQLHQLPWGIWSFVESYQQVEISASSLDFERVASYPSQKPTSQVRILVVLGNSVGIDVKTDLGILTNLEDVESQVLVEPQRQELYNILWEESWDIVFFAGHSETIEQQGVIYLNSHDILTISDLKYALKRAINQGLQLAIFNSCDGLGLAFALSQLSLPQTIVMREYVPDKVAQEFLRYLLSAYRLGLSLTLAVRQARERLQGWEGEYPYSSWLPIIYQNPTVIPARWEDLKQNRLTKRVKPSKTEYITKNSRKKGNWWQKYQMVLMIGAIATCLVSLVQSWGGLQFWELKAFDRAMSWRVPEARDDRLLIVTVDDEDIKYQEQNQLIGRGSLGDAALLKFLLKIQPFNPKVVASDIIHDFPFTPELNQAISSQNNFFAICRIKSQASGITSINPPNLPLQRVGFSNLPIDPDGVIRRQILGMSPDQVCQSSYSLSLRLALQYLDYPPTERTGDILKIGTRVFPRFQSYSGGYHLPETESLGYQILLNYRSTQPQTITLREILNGSQDDKLSELVKDKIILIGIKGHNLDLHYTPYSHGKQSTRVSGVMIHAQMTSNIISAVLDNRQLIWWFPESVELLWIAIWCGLGGGIIVIFDSTQSRAIALMIALAGLGISFYLLLTIGGWLPAIAPALGILSCYPLHLLIDKLNERL